MAAGKSSIKENAEKLLFLVYITLTCNNYRELTTQEQLEMKETPELAATQRNSLDNRCSHIGKPDKIETVAEAVCSLSKSNKEAAEALYHLHSQAAVTAHFLKRLQPTVNILITRERKREGMKDGSEEKQMDDGKKEGQF